MHDYVKNMMDTWTTEGEQAAYDLGAELLQQIDAEFKRLRNQADAISALGIYLRDNGNVVEVLDPKHAPVLDTLKVSERSRLIVETAIALWQRLPSGNDLVKVQHVLQEMNSNGLDLGVQQPLAVIGTVLARADGFTKIARNTFEYRSPIADLPF